MMIRIATHRRILPLALGLAGLLIPLAVDAAPPNAPTTYAECYKSAHTCERSRCKPLDGREQVTCMQQCNREYETCASHAAAAGQPTSGPAQSGEKKQRRYRHGKATDQAD